MTKRPSEGRYVRIPVWLASVFVLVSFFNLFIFVVLIAAFWRPDTVPVPITGDVAIGLHLQLFEAFLAALGIGLAVLGFVGYQAIREAAERRADDAIKAAVDALEQRRGGANTEVLEPNLTGLDPTATTRQEEDRR